MVKADLFKDEEDTLDELSEQEVKSPKKRKRAAKKEESVSPDGKGKPGRAPAAKSSWSKEEEEDLMACLQIIIAANMNQVVKDFPRLAARKADGCIKHWNGIRRKHEAAVLGAPTINYNGKKIDVADRVKSDPAGSK